MLYTKDKHMLGSCCVDVLLLLFAMVWCVWTAKSWLVRTQRAALSHVYCLPALCPSFYIFSLHRLHIQYVFVCDVVRSAASRFTLKHRWTFNTHQTLWHTSHRTGGLQHCLFSIQLFFVALSLSKNQSHSAPGSAAGLHYGTTVPHCFIYVYSRSCHFTCRAKNLTSCHIFKTHTQGNH